MICDKAVAELKVEVEKQLSLYRETGKQTHLNFGAYFLGLLDEIRTCRALEEIKAGRSSVDELRREANRAYAMFVKSVDDDTTPESEELSKLINEVHKEVDKQKENALNGLLGVKTKDSTSTKRDYHGFLDDKAPGAVKEIKRQLEKKDILTARLIQSVAA